VNSETAIARAREIASNVIAPQAAANDREGCFSIDAVRALGESGLLGLLLPATVGGSQLGPEDFAEITAILAEADPSVAMVFVMHVVAAAPIAVAPERDRLRPVLEEIARGRHLSTLAFSEVGSRSHFWAPVSRAERDGAGVRISARKSWVTSAGHAQSYVVSTQSPDGAGPTESTLYLVLADAKGLSVAGAWDGMGMRANAAAPMTLDRCEVAPGMQLTREGGGFAAMMETVLPLFNLGSAAVALGICRAVVAATTAHLKNARFEHLGASSLGESLPNLRAQLATMQIQTDGLAARIDDVVRHLAHPDDLTMLRVLEVKAAAGEAAIDVTSLAMRTCGGAAFSKHTGIERFFRDAHAGVVMAPTADVLRDLIGKALLGLPLF
jgi:alkylation response protein AidB-like acyl-CoA dehydrogenase